MRNSQEGTPVRQNSSYSTSRKHEANLRRNPMLHFQIGLILALIAAIFFIELRIPEKVAMVPDQSEADFYDEFDFGPVQREPEKKIPLKTNKRPPAQQSKVIIDEPIETRNDDSRDETPFDDTEPSEKESMVHPSTPVYDDFDDEEPVSVMLVEQVPIFPGCEGLDSNEERRDCMSTKVSKFVSRKFRTEKGEGLGLEGEQRIFVVFKIDKDGNITDVKTKAPHKILEKEANRVIQLLPTMTPGKMGRRAVNVTMALPIIFILQD